MTKSKCKFFWWINFCTLGLESEKFVEYVPNDGIFQVFVIDESVDVANKSSWVPANFLTQKIYRIKFFGKWSVFITDTQKIKFNNKSK